VHGEDENIVVRDMMNMSLSFDHRVIDGATCFKFLARVAGLLEQPNLLFMEMA
jgi:pyruvate dehydrogenase E2 component (dihydrolipoamide acetyltransferase)